MATGPVTTKKRATKTTYTQVPGSAGPYDPFANSGPFQGSANTPPAEVTRATSGYTGSQNHLTALAANSTLTDVPQSYLDEVAAGWELSERNTGRAQNPTQEVFDQTAKQAWDSLTPDERQRYVQQDQQKVAAQNQANLQRYAGQEFLSGPARDQQVANQMWQPVTQAQDRALSAQDAQKTANRGVEASNAEATRQFGLTLDQQEALRRAGIDSTNAANSTLAGNYMNETLAANQRNVGFANQLSDAANATNANQTGLFNTFQGQMNGINANQSAALAGFLGDVSSSNARQDANLAQFGGAVQAANAEQYANLAALKSGARQATAQQNAIVNQYMSEMAGLNSEDRAAYQAYLNETNPLIGQLVAQGSNPEYVHNMEDVVKRYRELSTPQITDQERFLAELSRRKFESDDKASRDAVMQQLATRGLKSGGLVIANQQAAQQQNSQDRMLNELGLNAQAVSRGMQGLAGYADASSALRNADDQMRNFQDQYAQNEYIRRGNLAQQRNNQSLATTNQIGQRDTGVYNARTQSNQLNYGRTQDVYNASTQTTNANYGRNLDYYNAGTETVNNNFARTQAGYDATSQTNRDNAGRNAQVFDAGTTTNNNNFGRTQTAIGTQIGVNQGNLGNFLGATNLGIGTNNDNNARDQGGINSAEIAAGSKRQATNQDNATISANRAAETATANNWVPIATGTAETGTRIQQGLTREQQDAINALLGLGNADQARKTAGLT